MDISDAELRRIVRDVLGKLNRPDSPPTEGGSAELHGSHARVLWLTSGDAEGFCLIEPAVSCTHCGYCQSLGH